MKKLKALFFLISLLLSQCSTQRVQNTRVSEDSPPNYIIILVDDMGFGDVGFNGCKDIPTPNIDRIARQGVKFTNGYVTWGACGPSRAGMITGRYQDRFGFSRNPLFAPNDPNQGLPLSEETIAAALKKADYKTAALGKWHLGAHPTQRPMKRGFDHFFGFLTGGHRYFPEEWTLEDAYAVTAQFDAYKTKLLHDETRIEEKEYLTDALSREAVNYVKQFKDEPFFMYLAYNAPHGPLQATEKYLQRFQHVEDRKRRIYSAMVSAVDDGVGLLLDELEASGIHENTMVVFLSDNGGPEPKNGSDNGPFRGTKGTLFEGGIHVPFAIQWPAKIKAGTVYEEPIISLDLFATMVANAGRKIKLKNPLDGVNLMPYLTGANKKAPHEILYWSIHDKQHSAIRNGNNKLHTTPESKALFDLQKDIAEEQSRFASNQNLAKALEGKYQEWRSEMKSPVFMGLGQNKKYNELHPERWGRQNEKVHNNKR